MRKVFFLGLSLILVWSCSKYDDIDNITQEGNALSIIVGSEEMEYSEVEVIYEMEEIEEEFKAKLQEFAENTEKLLDEERELILKEINESGSRGDETREAGDWATWGIGTGETVWKWNGTHWFEPNPAAHLKRIDVSQQGSSGSSSFLGVWGIGRDYSVWIWNGSYWTQPNPAAHLFQISAFNERLAVGMGWNGRVFITRNGGQSWSEIVGQQIASYTFAPDNLLPSTISISNDINDGFIWGVNFNYELVKYNLNTLTWTIEEPSKEFWAVSTGLNGGPVWAIERFTTNVYVSTNNSSPYQLYQPNSAAHLSTIDNAGTNTAWGIGDDRKVWRTNNSGGYWSQPNPAARLHMVSSGIE